MNRILNEVNKIAKENFQQYLPEVDISELEENGKVYYMNSQNGTNFDFFGNEHFSPFMCFYDDKANMGAIKILLYTDGTTSVFIYKNGANSPFKTINTTIEATENEMLELAIILEKVEMTNKWDFSIEDIDSDMKVSDDEIKEYLTRNEG